MAIRGCPPGGRGAGRQVMRRRRGARAEAAGAGELRGVETDLDGSCGGGVPGSGRDVRVAKGFGEPAAVVAQGAEPAAEVAQEAAVGDELGEGVCDLDEVVEDLGHVGVGAVGVLELIAPVLLGAEPFVLDLPA